MQKLMFVVLMCLSCIAQAETVGTIVGKNSRGQKFDFYVKYGGDAPDQEHKAAVFYNGLIACHAVFTNDAFAEHSMPSLLYCFQGKMGNAIYLSKGYLNKSKQKSVLECAKYCSKNIPQIVIYKQAIDNCYAPQQGVAPDPHASASLRRGVG